MYGSPSTGNTRKALTYVAPAAPQRWQRGGSITNGLNLSPAAGNNIGTTIWELPRIDKPWRRALVAILGSLSTTSVGAGTVLSQYFARNGLVNRFEMSYNGGDKFHSYNGGMNYLLGGILYGYRSGEQLGSDTFMTAPTAAAATVFSLTFAIPFNDPTVYPRLFSMGNFYEGHGAVSVQLRMDLGRAISSISGDNNVTFAGIAIDITYDLIDFDLLKGFGEPYVRETSWPRLQYNQLDNQQVYAGPDSLITLSRGLYARGYLFVGKLNNNTEVETSGNPFGLTQDVSLVRDVNDRVIDHINITHLQRTVADRYTNFFRAQSYAYFADLIPDREVTQFVDTNGMVSWNALISSAADHKFDVLEMLCNIPNATIPVKPGNQTVYTKRRG